MGERACRARRALAPARVADTAVGQEGGPQSAESRAAARPTIGASAARPDAATASGRSHWEPGPTGSLQAPSGIPSGTSPGPTGSASGTFKARLEKRVGARRERLGRPTLGPSAFGEAPSPSPTRRGARRTQRAPTGRPRHYRARAMHFLWGTFLGKMDSSHNVVSLRTARNKIKGAYTVINRNCSIQLNKVQLN